MTDPRVETTKPEENKTAAQMIEESMKDMDAKLDEADKKKLMTELSATFAKPMMKYVGLPLTLLPIAAGGIVVGLATTTLPLIAGLGTLAAGLYSAGKMIALLSSDDFEKEIGKSFKKLEDAGKAKELPKKDVKYFLKSTLGLGFSAAKLGTSVALFSLAPAGAAAVFLFGALGVVMGITGFFGTLVGSMKLAADVKQKIESTMLQDLPKEDAPEAAIKPAAPDTSPAAVSALKSESAFNAAAQVPTNDNVQQPVSKPEPKRPAA